MKACKLCGRYKAEFDIKVSFLKKVTIIKICKICYNLIFSKGVEKNNGKIS